jgi:N6-adenosine-specific RNA methylase IME4
MGPETKSLADPIDPEVLAVADRINALWHKGIGAVIETGQELIAVRARWDNHPGWWSRLLGREQWEGQGLLNFAKSHAYRLIAIAEDTRLVPHVGQLPSDTYTLYQLTRLSDERFAEMLDAGMIHPAMKRNDASAETRAESKAADEVRVKTVVPVPGKYRALIVDPPWDYEWLSLAGRAAPGYATMTHDQLLALDVGGWAEDNCHLYLWTTNNFMTRAVDLMAHWGFAHKTVLTWVKPRWGLGAYFRNSTEHVLFGVRGEMRTRSDSIATHFEAPLGEHSEKPEAFYNIVRAASFEPFGEIFQRTDRPDFQNVFAEDATRSRPAAKEPPWMT